jgi:hypothetical protein
MRLVHVALTALPLVLGAPTGTAAETLGDARVGFSAERILIVDEQRFEGKMWHMPGEQRHEQNLLGINPVFILRAASATGELVLPQLHTVIEFALPEAISALGHLDLGHRVGSATIEGVETTEYALDQSSPDGHATGSLWLSSDGIPMKCVGTFEANNGRQSTIVWRLRRVRIGKQDPGLFEVPRGYAKLPPEAAATLLGLRLGGSVSRGSRPSPAP